MNYGFRQNSFYFQQDKKLKFTQSIFYILFMQKTCDKMFVLISKNTFIVRKILLFVYYNNRIRYSKSDTR